jgi:glycosyltransferase involved in cell wall biosynthesis
MKIILIGNYTLDNQESMERFTLMLYEGFKTKGIVTDIWRPIFFFGNKSLNPHSGLGKYLGYIDKWLLFPLVLKWRLLKKSNRSHSVFFHICDHSNAPYLKHLPKDRSGITCHDVLAIRGAFGYADAYCPASGMGKILQKWILQNLSKAKKIACVSQHTLLQLKDLCERNDVNDKNWVVILNAFNAPFRPLLKAESQERLQFTVLNGMSPFILHIGSSLPRKNRKLLLDMVYQLGNQWNGYVCFAGEALDEDFTNHAEKLGIKDRVVSIVRPNHDVLVALLSTCEAFVFPSFSEGFGWPVIEAQACGAPVIASDLAPMPEVSGGMALHAPPTSSKLFAEAFLKLKDIPFRESVIQNGFQNVLRFSNDQMINDYISLYFKPN